MNSRTPHPVCAGRPGLVGRVAAFTLIEVLVATFVFAIVLASLFGTWRVIARSTESAISLAAEAQRTRLALQCIEEALSATEMFQSNLRWYSFLADTAGPYAEVSFAANLSDSFPGSGFFLGQRLRRITLRVEPAPEGGNHLVMHQTPLLAPLDGDVETYPLVLATEVSLFQLRFWDRRRSEMIEDWTTTNQIPMVVEVILGTGTENRLSRRPAAIVSRAVRLPDLAVPPTLQGGVPGGPQGGGGVR
ncbi:MAG: prepilin-type N-terminal cleavage/methylation domain-containing protein [Verrucomicrobiae bacterium]|nr:prepilin-type N-terminal cleavage/methylation domain-containing protein [Verrucomicrobiae bacterium]